jgi:hypothetical protein
MLALFGPCVLEEVDNPEYSNLLPPYRTFCTMLYKVVWRNIRKDYRGRLGSVKRCNIDANYYINGAYNSTSIIVNKLTNILQQQN